MSLKLRRGDLVKWLRLMMNIYIEETSDTSKVVCSKVIYELKWLKIVKDDVKFKWMKYWIAKCKD